ncbi:deoxyribonuclease V [Paenibacillus shenyangensis]|uniref:deoxyribonuclease V n=1 Tax=Paenibacillus sp. A9 TaxID=1284352 RepID=UPI00036B7A8A|nr:deoxyribonuclease V [Paenibacillus sp. A9]
MKVNLQHRWDLNEEEAILLQQELAEQIITTDQLPDIHYVAGVDVAYSEHTDQLIAAVVILNAVTLEVVESITVKDAVQFSYLPSLFSFRELPPVIKALEQVHHEPQLIVCDSQGLAHPRRFGLACHLGLLLDVPAIGCGKTRLIGEYTEPGRSRGSAAPLIDGEEKVGSVLRTQTDVKPVFVSVGHRISLESANEWILRLAPRYRLPETTRMADQLVRKAMSEQQL